MSTAELFAEIVRLENRFQASTDPYERRSLAIQVALIETEIDRRAEERA